MAKINNQPEKPKFTPEANLHFVGLGAALYDSNLSADAFRLHCILYGMLNRDGYCQPSNEWLSERLGKSVASVTRLIQQLRKGGYIQTRQEPTKKGNIRRIYRGTGALPDQANARLKPKPKPEVDEFEAGFLNGSKPKESAAEKVAKAKAKAEAEKAAEQLAAEKMKAPEPAPARQEEPEEEPDYFLKAARRVYRKAHPTRAEWESFLMNTANKRTEAQLREELQRFAERFAEEQIEKYFEDEAAALASIKKMSHGRLWANFRRRWLCRPYKKPTNGMNPAMNTPAYKPFDYAN